MPSLPLYFPPSYQLSRALLCAELLMAAYDQYEQWLAQQCPRTAEHFHWQQPDLEGWQLSAPIWSVLSEWHVFNESEPFGFAARDPQGDCYLVFRGTESVQDCLDDLDLDQRDYPWQAGAGLVHDGFLKLYTSLRDQALLALDGLQPQARLWACGHSLGSTLSTLVVPDLLQRWPALPLQHYNFASPRLASPAFASYYNGLVVPTYRLVNDSDLVPEVPPADSDRWFYQHLGLPVTFTASYGGVAANHSMGGCYLYALNNPDAPMKG